VKSKGLKFVLVFVLGLSLILSACGTDAAATEAPAGTEAPEATVAPESTEAPEATEAPASDEVVAAYEFTNTGEVEICELYLSPTGVEEWGPDQLGEATIAASATFTLTDIPAGTYDAKVVGCNGEESVAELDIYNP
jgi:hypothetical protein